MNNMFCLDTRERDLITILASQESQVIAQLPVADIWIGAENNESIAEGGLVIERKSIKDLEASILDGRYREQRARILTFCQEKKAQPLYILEGALSSLTGRLQKKALMKFINRLTLHYQIPVLQTQNVGETAELVIALIEQWKEDPKALQRTTELVKVTDGIHIQKKANANDYRHFAISSLANCPGVSVKIAEALIDQFKSLQGVINATEAEIAAVKVSTRKVGPAVAKRLHEILTHV